MALNQIIGGSNLHNFFNITISFYLIITTFLFSIALQPIFFLILCTKNKTKVENFRKRFVLLELVGIVSSGGIHGAKMAATRMREAYGVHGSDGLHGIRGMVAAEIKVM